MLVVAPSRIIVSIDLPLWPDLPTEEPMKECIHSKFKSRSFHFEFVWPPSTINSELELVYKLSLPVFLGLSFNFGVIRWTSEA